MPPKTMASLANMLESEGSDVDMADNVDENAPPAKKAGQPPAAKKRKTKPASKRLSGGRRKGTSKAKRAPLADRSNAQKPEDDTEEVDEFAEDEGAMGVPAQHAEEATEKPVPKKRGRPSKKDAEKQEAAKAQSQPQAEEVESAPAKPKGKVAAAKSTTAGGKRAGKTKAQAQPESEAEEETTIPESQHVPMDIDESDLHEDQVPQSVYDQNSNARAPPRQQPNSRQAHRRAGSPSDTERGGDATLRRKLGDVTKKFETLQSRYNRLHDVGVKEAESNFERLKQQSQKQEQTANDLIASLKAELAAARKDASQNTSQTTQMNKVRELNRISDEKLKASESQLAALTEKLNLANSDNKSLQAKLLATRQASQEPNGIARIPGSAVKGKNAAGDRVAAAQAAIAQLKEDLYSDLTGLIVRGVEKTNEADVFDCIQTGRNGTLHFHLQIDTSDAHGSYDEIEFTYEPQLNENRDRDLLEVLPDYLTEEITFSRANAAKFYSRICDTLTRHLG